MHERGIGHNLDGRQAKGKRSTDPKKKLIGTVVASLVFFLVSLGRKLFRSCVFFSYFPEFYTGDQGEERTTVVRCGRGYDTVFLTFEGRCF